MRQAPIQDIEWLFTKKKVKRTSLTLWNYILATWSKIKGCLIKTIPQDLEEVLKQPLFCNTFFAPDGSVIGDNFDALCVLAKAGYS
jgi:hypothetical protein